MKLCIIGPEGSGKTDLATMLNQYIKTHPQNGLSYLDVDIKTKEYFDDVLKRLNDCDWPESTKVGKHIILKWKWQTYKGRNIEVVMPEVAGQDLREEICGDDNSVKLKERIKEADLIMLLCDVYGYLNVKDEYNDKTKLQNAWIVEKVLQEANERQKVILIVTKADFFEYDLPEDKWDDRQTIESLLTNYIDKFTYHGHKNLLQNRKLLAVSSVSTSDSENLTEENIVRKPKVPLKSRGMDKLIDELLGLIENNNSDTHQIQRKSTEISTSFRDEKIIKNEKNDNPIVGPLKAIAVGLCIVIISSIVQSVAAFFVMLIIVIVFVMLKKINSRTVN